MRPATDRWYSIGHAAGAGFAELPSAHLRTMIGAAFAAQSGHNSRAEVRMLDRAAHTAGVIDAITDVLIARGEAPNLLAELKRRPHRPPSRRGR